MPYRDPPPPIPCGLCDRPHHRDDLTRHHTRPKSRGGTVEDIELLCRQCHGMVHATFTNATLAAVYPTLGRLKSAPELDGFLKWVRRQTPGSLKRNKSRRRKV